MAKPEKPLQPKLLTALTLVASGSDWDSAAEAVGMTSSTLRRYFNQDRRASEFVERVVRENLNTANNVLANSAPRLAQELVEIALDQEKQGLRQNSGDRGVLPDHEHQPDRATAAEADGSDT